jgi:hypothetical protein
LDDQRPPPAKGCPWYRLRNISPNHIIRAGEKHKEKYSAFNGERELTNGDDPGAS